MTRHSIQTFSSIDKIQQLTTPLAKNRPTHAHVITSVNMPKVQNLQMSYFISEHFVRETDWVRKTLRQNKANFKSEATHRRSVHFDWAQTPHMSRIV